MGYAKLEIAEEWRRKALSSDRGENKNGRNVGVYV